MTLVSVVVSLCTRNEVACGFQLWWLQPFTWPF
jgi:hypothetical protein